MHRRQLLGASGEALATRHLIDQGCQVRHRNWRVSTDGVRGELDVVVLDRGTLAIVEVRTRRGTRAGTAVESVTYQKRRRLRRLAGLYLAEHPHPGPVRGDVIAVQMPDDAVVLLGGAGLPEPGLPETGLAGPDGRPVVPDDPWLPAGTTVRHLRGAW